MPTQALHQHFFLDGGGEMGERMRACDWAALPVGAPGAWPESLKTLVGMMLSANQPMYIAWGAEGTMLYNDPYIDLLREKHPGALGRPLLEVWSEIREPLGAIFHQVREGQPVHMDDILFMVSRNGQRVEAHFSFSLTPVRQPDGVVAGLFCACTETTAQVLADQVRTAATERQRQLFARAPGFITILNGPEHVFEFVNESYLTLSGGRDFIGRSVRDVFPELAGQGFYEWLDEVYATGQRFIAHDVPIRLQREPGQPQEQRYLDFIYEPMLGDDGRATGIFCEGYDVTDTHMAHAELVSLNADLERQVAERAHERSMFWQLTPDLLAVANKEGYFEKSNPAWLDVLGWTEQQVRERPISELVHPDDRVQAQACFERLERGESLVRFVDRCLHKDGSHRWISWTAVPEEGKFYCSGRDITAERAAAEALVEAQSALRQAQKMEAVGQLTGGIAHDFNNLLATIGGSLQLLQGRLESGKTDGARRYITMGQESVRRAAALTHRLLAFSRRQTLDPKPVDVNRLVAGLEDLVRRTVGPTVVVEVVGAGGLWPTRVDASQLENSLLNLCINGRDAMLPEGGRLTIETANKWLDDRAAEERELPPGQYISLCVTDSGSGMTPEVVRRAFDPFFTTKPIGQGTGLGLSMVYGFARQSEGQVRIYSETGRGTTICMYLPRYTGDVDADEARDEVAELATGEGETILIVEDEEPIRVLLSEVLRDAGYTVIGRGDGASGLKVLEGNGRVDLLMTDVGLPGGLNGRQVADAARVTRPGLKVLFITGYAENAAVGNGHLERGMEVVTKPFEIVALANKVRQMLER